jgi:hypothetical protein
MFDAQSYEMVTGIYNFFYPLPDLPPQGKELFYICPLEENEREYLKK